MACLQITNLLCIIYYTQLVYKSKLYFIVDINFMDNTTKLTLLI